MMTRRFLMQAVAAFSFVPAASKPDRWLRKEKHGVCDFRGFRSNDPELRLAACEMRVRVLFNGEDISSRVFEDSYIHEGREGVIESALLMNGKSIVPARSDEWDQMNPSLRAHGSVVCESLRGDVRFVIVPPEKKS